MTNNKSFKRRVRTRMAKTGERYAAARRQLVATADQPSDPGNTIAQPDQSDHAAELSLTGSTADPTNSPGMSTEAMRRRTGKDWDEWFALIDAWGGTDRKHPEIAAWLQEIHEVDGWWAQSITVGYERARGMRAFGQLTDGFASSASKTVAVPIDRIFDAFVDPDLRARWLPGDAFAIKSATPGKSVRAVWDDGSAPASRVDVYLTAKGDEKSQAAIQHRRLADATASTRMKEFWRERLTALQQLLES